MITGDLLAALKLRKSDSRIILAAPKMPLASLKSSVKSTMVKAYNSYQKSGDIGKLSLKLRGALGESYAQAYALGKKSTDVSKRELKWVDKQKQEQFKYLDGFMNDLDADASTMDPVDRLGAYLKKLDGMYWSGYVAGSPDGSQLNWVLDLGSENCDDCQGYADNSPYNRDEMEAVPGDGSTECGQFCNCWLELSK